MMFGDTIYTGLFFESGRPSLEDVEPVLKSGGPLATRELRLEKEQTQKIIERMM